MDKRFVADQDTTTALVFTMSWDTDDGLGCAVFANERMRDAALHQALMSYVDEGTAEFNRFSVMSGLELFEAMDGGVLA